MQTGRGRIYKQKRGRRDDRQMGTGKGREDSTAPAGGRSPPHRSGAEVQCRTGMRVRACVVWFQMGGQEGRWQMQTCSWGGGWIGYSWLRGHASARQPAHAPHQLTRPSVGRLRAAVTAVGGLTRKRKESGTKKSLGAGWWLALRLVWQGRGLGELSVWSGPGLRLSVRTAMDGPHLRRNMFFLPFFLLRKWN